MPRTELPLILKRKQDTIPTYMRRGTYSLKHGIEVEGETRRVDPRGEETSKRQRVIESNTV